MDNSKSAYDLSTKDDWLDDIMELLGTNEYRGMFAKLNKQELATLVDILQNRAGSPPVAGPDETPPQNTIAIADRLLEAFESYESEGGWTPASDPAVYKKVIIRIVGKLLAERDAALANMRAVCDELIAENRAMREAIGKLPMPNSKAYETWGVSVVAISSCYAAAQAASPRAKEIEERLELLRQSETVIKELKERLAKAEAAARAGQVLRAHTHKLIGDGHNRYVVRTELAVEYDETIQSLAAEPHPKESEVGDGQR